MSRSSHNRRVIIWVVGLALLLLLWWRLGNGRNASGPPATPPTTAAPVDVYALLNQVGPHWLPNVDLSRRTLYGAQFQRANLRGANLSGANLAHADLTRANLVLADLHGAQLLTAQLRGADLALANLTDARLTAADLTAAKLEGADLKGAQLTRARLDHANLTLADLRHASLRFASLRGANLTTVDFSHADLQGADLTNAVLNNADLDDVNLQGVVLTGIISDAHTIWPANFHPERPGPRASFAPAPPNRPSHGLRIEMDLLPALSGFFNQVAQPTDTARIDQVSDLALLAAVRTGQRMAVFKSAALGDALVPRIADQIDILGYNLEHGPTNPLDEQTAPVAAVQRMRQLADRYGLRLALGPDHDFALSHGASLAPLADRFVLQLQRVQEQPELARAFVISMSTTLRKVKPDIELNVQVAATGDVAAVAALIDSLRMYIDGVSLLTDRSELAKVSPLWERLRTGPAGQARPAPPALSRQRWPQQVLGLLLGLLLQAAVLLGLWGTWGWLNGRLFSEATTLLPTAPLAQEPPPPPPL